MQTDHPFPLAQQLTPKQNRTLALAAVFQATQLTHMTAMGNMTMLGESGAFYFEQLIKAALNIRAEQANVTETLAFFHQLSDVALGLKTLEGCITEPFSQTTSRIPKWRQAKLPMRYALALLQLEKKVYARPDFVARIQDCQQQILKQLSFFDGQMTHASILANLAQTYVETAGQIQPRIMVRGNAQTLKDNAHTNRIRASLMTGLQMAHLWRQLGGRSWQLIFYKRHLLTDLQHLARLQYQMTTT